jgi:hypothetical protein
MVPSCRYQVAPTISYTYNYHYDLSNPQQYNQLILPISETVTIPSYIWAPVQFSLFTTGGDIVDFGALTAAQITAITLGDNLYNALGGNDTITLPDLVRGTYVLSPEVNVARDPLQPFVVGALTDKSTNRDTITGDNGNYIIEIVGPATVWVSERQDGGYRCLDAGFIPPWPW